MHTAPRRSASLRQINLVMMSLSTFVIVIAAISHISATVAAQSCVATVGSTTYEQLSPQICFAASQKIKFMSRT
jgi:hypothetical protein